MIKGPAGQFRKSAVNKRTWSVHSCTCRDRNLLEIVESKSGGQPDNREHGPEVGLMPEEWHHTGLHGFDPHLIFVSGFQPNFSLVTKCPTDLAHMGCVDNLEDKLLTDSRNHFWSVNYALLGHNNHDTLAARLACASLAFGATGP